MRLLFHGPPLLAVTEARSIKKRSVDIWCIDMREREREVVLGTLRNRSDNNKREREVQKGEREYNLPCARKPGFYTIVAHVGS